MSSPTSQKTTASSIARGGFGVGLSPDSTAAPPLFVTIKMPLRRFVFVVSALAMLVGALLGRALPESDQFDTKMESAAERLAGDDQAPPSEYQEHQRRLAIARAHQTPTSATPWPDHPDILVVPAGAVSFQSDGKRWVVPKLDPGCQWNETRGDTPSGRYGWQSCG